MSLDETQLRDIIDNIPAIAWCSLPDGSNEFLNRRWLQYTGFTENEALGDGWRHPLHPDDVERVTEAWRVILASGSGGEVEFRLRRFDGEYRWFFFRVEPYRDAQGTIVRWYGINTDIEELKRSEKGLQELIDYLPQLVMIRAADGSLLYTNRRTLDYLGRTFEELQAPGYDQTVIHPEDWDLFSNNRKQFSSKHPFELEARLLGADGVHRWFLFRYNPLRDGNGYVLRWFVSGTEIEHRKQAEARIQNENLALREEIARSSMFEEIIGTSPPLRKVLAEVARVATTDSTVLIFGDTGTGKELIARAIHKRSKRSARAFISVNCGAIPPSLILSELFGHEKGAFTGALQRRVGRFEAADGGTIFLDEVGELPSETQVALLRVLQDREFERIGGSERLKLDVRVLAATNRNLRGAVNAGTFRQDLFYRLNVFPIEMPPLRERADDIRLLAEYMIDRYAKKVGKKFDNLATETLNLFRAYAWPGNVRELQNVIERAVVLCEEPTFSVDETWLRREPTPTVNPAVSRWAISTDNERALIEAALAESRGRVSGSVGAAAKLGIPRQTLESKILRLGINKHRFRT
jgi:formate hydrogenlyase transcriptional activator